MSSEKDSLKRLGLVGPWKRETNAFILNETGDELHEDTFVSSTSSEAKDGHAEENAWREDEWKLRENEMEAWKARYNMLAAEFDDVDFELQSDFGYDHSAMEGLHAIWEARALAALRARAALQQRMSLHLKKMALVEARIQKSRGKRLRLVSCLAEEEEFSDRHLTAAKTVRQFLKRASEIKLQPEQDAYENGKELRKVRYNLESHVTNMALLDTMSQTSQHEVLRLKSLIRADEKNHKKLIAAADTLRLQIGKTDEASKRALDLELQAKQKLREHTREVGLKAKHNMLSGKVNDAIVERDKETANVSAAMDCLRAISEAEVAFLDTITQTSRRKTLWLESSLVQAEGDQHQLIAVAETLRQALDCALEGKLRVEREVDDNDFAPRKRDENIAQLTRHLKRVRGQRCRLAAFSNRLRQEILKADEAYRLALEPPLRAEREIQDNRTETWKARCDTLAVEVDDDITERQMESGDLNVAMEGWHAIQEANIAASRKDQDALQQSVESHAKEIRLLEAMVQTSRRKTLQLESCLAQAEGERARLVAAADALEQMGVPTQAFEHALEAFLNLRS